MLKIINIMYHLDNICLGEEKKSQSLFFFKINPEQSVFGMGIKKG